MFHVLLLAMLLQDPKPLDTATIQGRVTSANDIPGETGRGTASIGEIVKLRAVFSTTTAGHTAIVDITNAPTAYDWEVVNPPPKYKLADFISDDGRYISFASGVAGDYHFTVGIAQNVGPGKPLVKLAKYTLTVTTNGTLPQPPTTPPQLPRPPPPETPRPKPQPPTDDDITGIFGLAPKIRDRIALMPKLKTDEIVGIAQNYRVVLTELSQGKITLDDSKRKIAELNGKVLVSAEQRANWAPFWTMLNGEMNKLDRAGKLKTAQDAGAAFAEIYLGLTLGGEVLSGP